MVVGFTTTYVGNAYHHSIHHYVIKFVSDLRQLGVFLRVLRFPSPIKLTSTIYLIYLLKVALNTITLTPIPTKTKLGDIVVLFIHVSLYIDIVCSAYGWFPPCSVDHLYLFLFFLYMSYMLLIIKIIVSVKCKCL